MIVAVVSVCVADDVVLPWYLSFMDVMCDLSAKIAMVFNLIRRSLSPVGVCTDSGYGSKSCSLAMGLFVCFAGGERWIIIAAGSLIAASRINPVGSMMVLYAVFVQFVYVSSACSVIVGVFLIAS